MDTAIDPDFSLRVFGANNDHSEITILNWLTSNVGWDQIRVGIDLIFDPVKMLAKKIKY